MFFIFLTVRINISVLLSAGNIFPQQQLPLSYESRLSENCLTSSVWLLFLLSPALMSTCLSKVWRTVYSNALLSLPGVSEDTPAFLITIGPLPAIQEIVSSHFPSLCDPAEGPRGAKGQGHFKELLKWVAAGKKALCLLSLADWERLVSSPWTASLRLVGNECQTAMKHFWLQVMFFRVAMTGKLC